MLRDFVHRIKYPALTFGLSFIVLIYFFHTVLFSPNSYMFASGGDGIMNYYSYLFQAKHGASTFWAFEGMNYPYYEHVIYTGTQPIQSWLVSQLGLTDYGLGIMNFSMLISYPICSVFLFLILKHYKVSLVWAIIAAIAITYLSPQLGRLTGHFALSYVSAIPGMWWLLIKCKNGDSKLWALLSFLYLFSFFLTHPYLGMILSFMCLFYWSISYLYTRHEWRDSVGFITVQVILPIVLFRMLMFSTDTHVDRIDEPAGFFNLYGNWSSVFMAHHGPMSNVTRALEVRMPSWESWAYVGFSSMVFFALGLFYLVIKRKTLPFKLIFKHDLFVFFLAAYAILIFAFCFPFKISWMHWLADYFGMLKQFRVLGRFTWIFYFVFATGSVIALYRIYINEKKNLFIGGLFFIGMTFSFIEGYSWNDEVSQVISSTPNSFDEQYLDEETKELAAYLKANDYDAFFFLPFFHLSSENLMILGEEKGSKQAYLLSYHSGLPMMNCLASRTSQSESATFNNFFSAEFIEKELIYDLPTGDKIAMITNTDYLNTNELRMTYTQDVEFSNNEFKLYQFNRDWWNTSYYFDEVLEKRKQATFDVGEDWKSSDQNIKFIYKSWNEQSSPGLKGKGGFNAIKMEKDELITLTPDQLEPGEYEVRFWFNHHVDRADIMSIIETEYQSGEAEWTDTYDLKESNLIVGQWLLVEMKFTMDESVKKVKILMSGNRSRKPYVVDELLIKKVGSAPLFSTGKIGGQEYIIYDNYWIKSDSFQEQ